MFTAFSGDWIWLTQMHTLTYTADEYIWINRLYRSEISCLRKIETMNDFHEDTLPCKENDLTP